MHLLHLLALSLPLMSKWWLSPIFTVTIWYYWVGIIISQSHISKEAGTHRPDRTISFLVKIQSPFLCSEMAQLDHLGYFMQHLKNKMGIFLPPHTAQTRADWASSLVSDLSPGRPGWFLEHLWMCRTLPGRWCGSHSWALPNISILGLQHAYWQHCRWWTTAWSSPPASPATRSSRPDPARCWPQNAWQFKE